MNFYKRHLGDYAKDTGHLSPLEHGVFTLLLDWYYASEQPIPADKVYRVAKATTKQERQAADAVLTDFFTRDGDVWKNKRADAEIAVAHAQAETNRRIAEEREAKRKAARTVHEPSHDSLNDSSTKERGGSREPSQTPDSTSQTPDKDQERSGATGETGTQAGAVCVRLRAEAGMIHTNPSDQRLITALAAGVPPDLIVIVAKEFPRKNLAYVVATATGRHNDAASQAAGASHGKPATGQPRESVADRVARANNQPTAAEKRAGQGGQPGGRIIDGECQSGAA